MLLTIWDRDLARSLNESSRDVSCTLNGASSVVGVGHATTSPNIYLTREVATSGVPVAGNSLTSVLQQMQRIVVPRKREGRLNLIVLS